MNAIIHADYEPIHTLLQSRGQTPLTAGVFPRLREALTAAGLIITRLIVYGNFHRYLAGIEEAALHTLDLETRPVTGPNAVRELTITALANLHEEPGLELYIIITNSPDIIPLLNLIRYHNKRSRLISTQNGYHHAAARAADDYSDLESLLALPPLATHPAYDAFETLVAVDPDTVGLARIARAREAARLFLDSRIHEWSAAAGRPVHFKSYLNTAAAILNRTPGEALEDFKLAHGLKYITLYQDPEWGLCLREGEEKSRLTGEG